ncbi:nucleolar protein 7/estrogen receptor coactivator-related [Anaeramoeba flamelloides]|uniref:Nucleolar protein 7/estrogen receptor coactivator-related n=1 Tax=Anaeramoeba flamelloides TaxID=1746091 RepID=A0ABQ8Y781_9EUKA|nr:nucleolar protein 7/estrogen receptor coactivator-related [Anaeramoeba flamelloides]
MKSLSIAIPNQKKDFLDDDQGYANSGSIKESFSRSPDSELILYTVSEGEDCLSISKKFGTNQSSLKQINDMQETQELQKGDKIIVISSIYESESESENETETETETETEVKSNIKFEILKENENAQEIVNGSDQERSYFRFDQEKITNNSQEHFLLTSKVSLWTPQSCFSGELTLTNEILIFSPDLEQFQQSLQTIVQKQYTFLFPIKTILESNVYPHPPDLVEIGNDYLDIDENIKTNHKFLNKLIENIHENREEQINELLEKIKELEFQKYQEELLKNKRNQKTKKKKLSIKRKKKFKKYKNNLKKDQVMVIGKEEGNKNTIEEEQEVEINQELGFELENEKELEIKISDQKKGKKKKKYRGKIRISLPLKKIFKKKTKKNIEIEIDQLFSSSTEDYFLPQIVKGESRILNNEHIKAIFQHLPNSLSLSDWEMSFCTEEDGISLITLYQKLKFSNDSLMIIQTTDGDIFGVYNPVKIRPFNSFYGTSRAFLFTFYPEFQAFKWSGKNDFYILSTYKSISFGGGSNYGIYILNDLTYGSSKHCETFLNDELAQNTDFKIARIEVFTFTF